MSVMSTDWSRVRVCSIGGVVEDIVFQRRDRKSLNRSRRLCVKWFATRVDLGKLKQRRISLRTTPQSVGVAIVSVGRSTN